MVTGHICQHHRFLFKSIPTRHPLQFHQLKPKDVSAFTLQQFHQHPMAIQLQVSCTSATSEMIQSKRQRGSIARDPTKTDQIRL